MEQRLIKKVVDDALGMGEIAKNKAMEVRKAKKNSEPHVIVPAAYQDVEYAVLYAVSVESGVSFYCLHSDDHLDAYLDSLSRFSLIAILEQLFFARQTHILRLDLSRRWKIVEIINFFATRLLPKSKWVKNVATKNAVC